MIIMLEKIKKIFCNHEYIATVFIQGKDEAEKDIVTYSYGCRKCSKTKWLTVPMMEGETLDMCRQRIKGES